MHKTAFVFPGQGSQVVGMGRDFYEHPSARAVYDTFDRLVSPQLSSVCFNGPETELRRTLYTQPAILATSLAALTLLRERCPVQPVVTAGHSLGEYAALYAANAASLETVAQLIKKRAELMEAAPHGAMSAVLGLNGETVESVVDAYRKESHRIIAVANYNAEQQVVISGEPEAVESVSDRLKEAGARRVLPLPVGGAFHSPLMNAAAETFAAYLGDFQFHNAAIPVITNVDAQATVAAEALQEKLSRQISHSVLWYQTMRVMVEESGVDTVIEVGPGKVLTGLLKKTCPDVRVCNVFDMASLEEVSALLRNPAGALSF